MLRSVKEILGYEILSLDGRTGRVADFIFDLETWQVRYLIADLGNLLEPRKVLISAETCSRPKWESQTLPVAMTRDQIRFSPEISRPEGRGFQKNHLPNNRLTEVSFFRIGEVPHLITIPMPTEANARFTESRRVRMVLDQPELRTVGRVIGYEIRACSEEAGVIDDFIIDDERWMIRYLIGAIRKIFPGRRVMFAPVWVSSIDAETETVRLGLKPETLFDGPEYDPTDPVNRQIEEVIYDFHGRPKYRL